LTNDQFPTQLIPPVQPQRKHSRLRKISLITLAVAASLLAVLVILGFALGAPRTSPAASAPLHIATTFAPRTAAEKAAAAAKTRAIAKHDQAIADQEIAANKKAAKVAARKAAEARKVAARKAAARKAAFDRPLLTLSGVGISSTAPFSAPASGDYTVHYTYNCANFGQAGNFQIFEYSGGDMTTALANAYALSGSGTAHAYGAGPDEHLMLNGECNWTIRVNRAR
jgi:hypothetical protein